MNNSPYRKSPDIMIESLPLKYRAKEFKMGNGSKAVLFIFVISSFAGLYSYFEDTHNKGLATFSEANTIGWIIIFIVWANRTYKVFI